MGVKLCSLTIRENHGMRAFENTGLKRIYGPNMVGILGGWRKLHNDQLHSLKLITKYN
jgi:hypothetical protein